MTVSAIGGASQPWGTQGVDTNDWRARVQQTMGPVAQLFGESPQQLIGDLQGAQTSLSSLATSKGVSQTDLLDAIQQGLQQSSANGGPQLSPSQMTNLANTIAHRVHHGGHHHHRGQTNAIAASAMFGAPPAGGSNDPTTGAQPASSTDPLKADLDRLIFELHAGQSGSPNGPSAIDFLTQLSQYSQTL